LTDALAVRQSRQCDEKEKLVHEIRNRISLILWAHIGELEDIIAGNKVGEQYSNPLQEALSSKKQLLELLQRHIREHGC